MTIAYRDSDSQCTAGQRVGWHTESYRCRCWLFVGVFVLQKERLQRPARCPDQLWQLIEACWAQDPRDRPSFADTLQTLQHLQQELSRGQQEAAAESPTGSSGQKQQSLQQQQAAQPEVQQQAAQPQEQQQGLEVIQHKDQLLSPKVPASAEQVPPSDTDAVACTDQSQGGHEDVDAHVAVVC